jgi:hypothetical protein
MHSHPLHGVRRRRTAYLAALVGAWLAAQPCPAAARDARLTPPDVPTDLAVSSVTHRLSMIGHAVGTQNYVCVRRLSGEFAWHPFGPQATLFSDDDEQVITHYLSENPDEDGVQRPTWQHSKDSSQVWAMPVAETRDAAYVAPGAVPWLLLQVVGDEDGPTGGRRLTKTRYIQRVHTSGGTAPTSGCETIGARTLVPYTTDYYFWAERD